MPQKAKLQPTEWEKMFSNQIAMKDISKNIKNFYNSIKRRTPQKNGQRI